MTVDVRAGWLAALVATLDRMPDVGSVASKMMMPGARHHDAAGRRDEPGA